MAEALLHALFSMLAAMVVAIVMLACVVGASVLLAVAFDQIYHLIWLERLRPILNVRGYDWMTREEQIQLIRSIGDLATRLPEWEQIAVIPDQSRDQPQALIRIAALLPERWRSAKTDAAVLDNILDAEDAEVEAAPQTAC